MEIKWKLVDLVNSSRVITGSLNRITTCKVYHTKVCFCDKKKRAKPDRGGYL